MKILYRFIIRSFLGPFAATFCIAIFVLLMQFLWVYIDDLVGKGLSSLVLIKFLVYVSITLCPLALPLSILLSSLMTFGNLAENYELAAMKSAGLSLQKIMRPLIVFSMFISLTAFVFSNNILPWANLKMQSMLFDITHSKPSFRLKEGRFNNGISGYSIRIEKKSPDGITLKNIMIYDHKSVQGNAKVAFADSGTLTMAENSNFLVVNLKHGNSYEDVNGSETQNNTKPFIRNKFREEIIRFDLSDFKMNKTDEQLFKTNYQMLNINQLKIALDSLRKKYNQHQIEVLNQIQINYFSKSHLYLLNEDKSKTTNDISMVQFQNQLPEIERQRIIYKAIGSMKGFKLFLESIAKEREQDAQTIRKFEVEQHKKFTLSIACAILFFIGAPLGAIIKKGGLGMPVVVSVIFFMFFYVIAVTGEKLVKEGTLMPSIGMWMAVAVFLPVGIFLSYKASIDAPLFA